MGENTVIDETGLPVVFTEIEVNTPFKSVMNRKIYIKTSSHEAINLSSGELETMLSGLLCIPVRIQIHATKYIH